MQILAIADDVLYSSLFCLAGRSPILEVAVLVLVTALFAYHVPFTRMSGPELITILFGECDPTKGHVSDLCNFVYDKSVNGTLPHAGKSVLFFFYAGVLYCSILLIAPSYVFAN